MEELIKRAETALEELRRPRARLHEYTTEDLVKLMEELIKALKKIDELEDVCGDSADRMVELVKERDNARMEVCELSGNGSCDSTEREAESRGWKYLFEEKAQ